VGDHEDWVQLVFLHMGGRKIAAGTGGVWLINSQNQIWRRNWPGSWQHMPGAGHEIVTDRTGRVWVLAIEFEPPTARIHARVDVV
jgi:hypothetical protein